MKPSNRSDRDSSVLLRRLTFLDNFESFEVEVEIPAASEVQIRNEFRDGKLPRYWLIVDQVGPAVVARGDTAWSRDWLYLQNGSSSTDTTVIVVFMR